MAGPLHLRAYVGPKDLGILSRVKPSLEEQVNFGWMGVVAKPLTLHTPVDSPLYPELGLDDRHSHAADQFRAVPAEIEEPALHAAHG